MSTSVREWMPVRIVAEREEQEADSLERKEQRLLRQPFQTVVLPDIVNETIDQ